MLRYALFDLDNTLYPPSSGLWEAIGQRINLYMIQRLGLDPVEVIGLRETYLNSFGTTLNGLRHHHDIDPGEFLAFVHDLPLENYLRHDAELDQMLARLSLEKVIFTNADVLHARRVLSHLGVARHFSRIVDILTLGFINKPDNRAYLKALDLIAASPEECIFIEDSLLNLLPAKKMGMLTVLVRGGGPAEGAHHQIGSVKELEGLLAELSGKWSGK